MQRFPTNGVDLFEGMRRIDRLVVLEGPTGRRSWSLQEKARIVVESFAPGVRVCDVARAHGLAPQHLSMWRSLARKGKLPMPSALAETAFADVEVVTEIEEPDSSGRWIEVCSKGHLVRLPKDTAARRIAEIAAALQAL